MTKQCKATMRTYGGWGSKADLGERCPDAATHGKFCWVHAQKWEPGKMAAATKLPPLPRTVTVHILGDVR